MHGMRIISWTRHAHHFLDFLRMPLDTTAMLFRLALCAGCAAASLATAALYLSGWMTAPGVFRIWGRVRSLQGHACDHQQSGHRLQNITFLKCACNVQQEDISLARGRSMHHSAGGCTPCTVSILALPWIPRRHKKDHVIGGNGDIRVDGMCQNIHLKEASVLKSRPRGCRMLRS